MLAVIVRGERVDRHHRRHPVGADVVDLLGEVGGASVHVLRALRLHALGQRPARDHAIASGMKLQPAHGGDEHRGVRGQPGGAALDVEEPLRPHVGTEAGLGDQEVAAVDADVVGDDGGVTVGDVAERPGVDQRRGVLQGLQQVRLDRLLEQGGHRPGGTDVLGGDRLAVAVLADHHAPKTPAQVGNRVGEGEHRHDLRGRGDLEARLAGHPVGPRTEADDGAAQGAVVDVHHPLPAHALRVEVHPAAVVEVVVDHRREQVVGGGDRMDVAGEVEVDPLHRHHLAVAAAGGPALDPEGRPHGGLADRNGGGTPDVVQPLGEADGGGGLTLAEGRGRDRRDHHVTPPGPVRHRADGVEIQLGDAPAVGLDTGARHAHAPGDLLDRPEPGLPGDLEVTRHRPGRPGYFLRVARHGRSSVVHRFRGR
ncbi:hypothetical protein KBTX_03082 [wastewater metagenome]|uniref:Uncharacterized protein n=2 Tax=unclassified sequences TaxID=12908 RepID=A0A5B8RDR8_9ZZZZ|nr:hypothetical protein KBTEX_03082 [uncultured organism]